MAVSMNIFSQSVKENIEILYRSVSNSVIKDAFSQAKDLFKWNERIFTIMGVWPLRLTYVKFTLWIVYLLIHMSMEFADLFHVFGNLELMILNLSESTLEIMILVKLMVMRFSRTLANLLRRIIDGVDVKNYENPEEMKIYLNYNRIAKTFFKLWVIMGISSAILYQMKPLEFRLKAVLRNETMPFILPYRTRLFFEINDSSTFWLVWIYQCPMMCMGIFHTATIGYLFSLVLHVCGELSVLTFRIKELDLSPRESSRIVFRDIANRHRNILGMAKDINEVFGVLLLEELLISTLLIGLTSYSVLVNIDFEETAMFLSFLIYGLTLLLLIYGYCVAGEYLIFESKNLYEAYYQCQWYDVSDSFKKQLIICMIGASKPIQLTGGGYYVFSLVSFTGVLQTAAGYISMLRTMIS